LTELAHAEKWAAVQVELIVGPCAPFWAADRTLRQLEPDRDDGESRK